MSPRVLLTLLVTATILSFGCGETVRLTSPPHPKDINTLNRRAADKAVTVVAAMQDLPPVGDSARSSRTRQPLIETNLWSGVSFHADLDSTRWLIESSQERVAVPTDRLILVEFRDRGFAQVVGSVLGGVYVGALGAAIGFGASWLFAPKRECPPPVLDQPCWTTPRVSAGRVGFALGFAGGLWAGMARPGKVVYVFRE